MHTTSGHFNHYWKSIGDKIVLKMKDFPWQLRLWHIEEEVTEHICQVELKIKSCQTTNGSKEIKTSIRRVPKEIKATQSQEVKATLEREEVALQDELRSLSQQGAVGDYNLILQGTQELEEVLKARPKKDTKRSQSDLQYVLWKALESRAGGRLDLKQSGLDQTNRAGLTSVGNCNKVFDALLGMYPLDHELHKWLEVEVVRWRCLGKALYDVGCFVKSQRKRCPVVFDNKLLRLWCRWEDASPGKGFNKYHGMFCTLRNYVRLFHMAGRVIEESNEAYNGTVASLKKVVKCMPSHEQRIDKINERAQGNLKGEVMKCRLQIDKKAKTKRRGPYKPRPVVLDDRTVVHRSTIMKELDGEHHVVIDRGNMIPDKWIDIYDWFVGEKAPKD